jgi:phosphoglycerate dehydrogenase-like enzyme
LFAGRYAQSYSVPLRRILGEDWAFDSWETADGPAALIERATRAEIIIGSSEWAREHGGNRAKASFESARKLRLVIIAFSGMDWLEPSWLPMQCVICNLNSGIDPIAEYVICAMLNNEVDLHKMDAELREQRWTWGGGTVMGRKHGELQGKTIGLVGFGRIAKRVAELARSFRMHAVAVSRTPSSSPDVAWWRTMDSLGELLESSDYVLLTVPGGRETDRLIGAAELARMKTSAVLINVARGSVVDEEALYDSLRERRIGGAVIDTWYNYPTQEHPYGAPSRFDFSSLDNVVMTPHAAGWTDALETRRVQTVVAQVRSYLSGNPISDIVLDKRSDTENL